MTQGNHIREIRKSLNLTLEEFGNKVGVTKTAIFKLEKNERNLTEQMTKSICREFNVNYDYLVHGEGEMFSDMPQNILDELCNQYDCNEEDRNMISEYLKLDAASRKVLKDYMRAVFGHSPKDIPPEQPLPHPDDIAPMSIDEKAAQYRKELEREERDAKTSKIS